MAEKFTIDMDMIGFMDLGRFLARAREEGPERLQVIAKRYGVGSRKAYYVIEVYKAFKDLGIPENELNAIGWTKAQVIASVVNETNWPLLLKMAQSHAVHELRDYVKGNELHLQTHCVQMYFTPDEFKLLATVLVAHGATLMNRAIIGKERALLKALGKLASPTTGGEGTDTPSGLS